MLFNRGINFLHAYRKNFKIFGCLCFVVPDLGLTWNYVS